MLIWADGFEHWGNNAAMNGAGYQTGAGGVTKDANYARTGSTYYSVNGGYYGNFERAFDPHTLMTAGIAVRIDDMGSRDPYVPSLSLYDKGSNKGIFILFYGDGSLAMVERSSGNIIGRTPVNTYGPNVWNYIELALDGPNEQAQLRLNNNVVLTAAHDLGGQGFNHFRCGNYGEVLDRTMNLADFYVTVGDVNGPNPGYLGDVRCRTIYPDANGPNQAWPVTGAASPVAALDNVPFDPNQYIAGANVGDVSDFTLGDIPANTAYVAALVVFPTCSKTDAGTCEITPQVTSGATEADLAPITPAVANAAYPRIIENDPATGNYWTKAGVNAVRLGFKRTA